MGFLCHEFRGRLVFAPVFRLVVIFLLLCRVAFGHVAMPGASATKVTYTRGLDLSGSYQGAGGIGGLLARTAAGGGSAFYHADAGGNITSLTVACSVS